MSVDEILALLLSDPTKALATLEILKQGGKLTVEKYQELKIKFLDIWNQKKFGFSPPGDLAKKLNAIDSTPEYKKLKQLIGKHKTLPLVRVGLYLESLNIAGDSEKVEQIRTEIYERHGAIGSRIVSMGSCGLMSDIINMLDSLEATGKCSHEDIVHEYEYVLNKYDDIFMFVSKEETEANIELRINQQVAKLPSSFFIVATGNAAKHGMTVIAKMNKEDGLRDKGYMFFPPKTQKYGRKNQYTWTFWRFL